MSDLRQNLQELIAIHGTGKVYAELYGKMKEEYEFLREFFSEEKAPRVVAPKKKVVKSTTAPTTTQDSDTTDMSASALRDAKIRIVKKEVASVEPDPLELFPPAVENQEEDEDEQESEVAIVVPPVSKPPTFKTPKEAKAWQKEQETKKKVELSESGIEPHSLLTKENLERWILTDSRTYAYIAREYVGLPEAMVSESAKAFGIQSETSKKRNEMIKKKKVQQRGSS
jgi:hypothetical protein